MSSAFSYALPYKLCASFQASNPEIQNESVLNWQVKHIYVHCSDADGFSWHMDGYDARNGKKFLDSKHSPIFLMDLRISCGGRFYSLEYTFLYFY